MSIRFGLAASGVALFLFIGAEAYAAPIVWMPTETSAFPLQNALQDRLLDETQSIEITVALKLRNKDQLDGITSSLLTVGNPAFEKWLNQSQVASDYYPTQETVGIVSNYLKSAGFTNITPASNNLLIRATGNTAAIRTAFNTEMAHVIRGGQEGIANLSAANVPIELSGSILAVLGLDTVSQSHSMMASTATPAAAPTGGTSGHYATEFPALYSASSLPTASKTTIGVITVGNMTPVLQDLATFDNRNGLPALHPTVVIIGSSSSYNDPGSEYQLDTQVIQAMAGGTIGNMILYAAPSYSTNDLTNAYNAALAGGATVINMSFGGCETDLKNSGGMAAADQIFQLAVSQGITFSASSGDTGSKECGATQGNVHPGTIVGALYPASSPYVIAVGGTTLYTNSGTYSGEAAWTYSGGESSLYEPKPSYQNNITPGSNRAVADIAFDADLVSGAYIIANGTQQTGYGTSLASPIFVGGWARINSGFPGPAIYSGGATPPASMFNDVTTGNNFDYSATTGWDYPTGFGSMKFSAFASIPIIPGAPSITVGAEACLARANIYWNATAGATSYNIYRAPVINGAYSQIGTNNSNYYFDNNSVGNSNTHNFYKVRACNSTAGCGSYSNAGGPVGYTSPCQ